MVWREGQRPPPAPSPCLRGVVGIPLTGRGHEISQDGGLYTFPTRAARCTSMCGGSRTCNSVLTCLDTSRLNLRTHRPNAATHLYRHLRTQRNGLHCYGRSACAAPFAAPQDRRVGGPRRRHRRWSPTAHAGVSLLRKVDFVMFNGRFLEHCTRSFESSRPLVTALANCEFGVSTTQ